MLFFNVSQAAQNLKSLDLSRAPLLAVEMLRAWPCLGLFPSRIRMSGIKGLQGVVRKTVNDELQANIWDPQHMDKIVPSLLFNLQHVEEAER